MWAIEIEGIMRLCDSENKDVSCIKRKHTENETSKYHVHMFVNFRLRTHPTILCARIMCCNFKNISFDWNLLYFLAIPGIS